jgi:hypothetical protein
MHILFTHYLLEFKFFLNHIYGTRNKRVHHGQLMHSYTQRDKSTNLHDVRAEKSKNVDPNHVLLPTHSLIHSAIITRVVPLKTRGMYLILLLL